MSDIGYVDYAEYYDYTHIMTEDISFYLESAQQTGGSVLELACGTGRILIPIAEHGIRIHGLDLSQNMLALAKKKVQEQNLGHLATLSLDNMTDFDLPEKGFSMAFIAARSFMHLFTQEDQISCLRCIHGHLKHNGLLLMDLYSPNLKWMAREPQEDFNYRREFHLSNGNRVVEKRRFQGVDILNQIFKDEILFEEYSEETIIHTKQVPLFTRFTFRFELELLLEKTGFTVESMYKDYQKTPYDGTGEILIVARSL